MLEGAANQRRTRNRRCLSKSSRASQACQACAASKVRCDNLGSCARCRKRQIKCIRSDSARPSSMAVSPSEMLHSQMMSTNINHTKNTNTTQYSPPTASSSSFVHWQSTLESLADQPASESVGFQASDMVPYMEGIVSQDLSVLDLLNTVDVYGEGGIWPFPQHEVGERAIAGLPISQGEDPPDASPVDVEAITAAMKHDFVTLFGSWKPTGSAFVHQGIADGSQQSKPPQNSTIDQSSCGTVIGQHLCADMRDQMLLVATQLPPEEVDVSLVRCFPHLNSLDHLLQLFFARHKNQPMPIIHVPTFSLSSSKLSLVMACAAAAAASSTNPTARRFGLALMGVAQSHLRQLVAYHSVAMAVGILLIVPS